MIPDYCGDKGAVLVVFFLSHGRMQTQDLVDVAIIGAIPLVTGVVAAAIFKMPKDAGATVVARPPAAVFGVVWPILYLMMGASWVLARRASSTGKPQWPVDVSLGSLTAVLVMWLAVYSRKRDLDWHRGSGWGMGLAIIACYIALVVVAERSTPSAVLLCPLLGWLHFALSLNFVEVQQQQDASPPAL